MRMDTTSGNIATQGSLRPPVQLLQSLAKPIAHGFSVYGMCD